MTNEDVELNSVTTVNGVIEISYKNEDDFNTQLSFSKYPGTVGVVESNSKRVRVFAWEGTLYRFEVSKK